MQYQSTQRRRRKTVMAQLIRVIWQFDYNISYAYMNNIGLALKALAETIPGFFPTISQGITNDSFTADRRGTSDYALISVERNAILGSMEWTEGIELNRLANHDIFRNCDKISRALFQICELRNVSRAGIRFYFVEQGVALSSSGLSSESLIR